MKKSDFDLALEIKKIIQDLTGKKHIFLTNRCNESLKIVVRLAKEVQKSIYPNFDLKSSPKLLMQKEGGWLTYPQLALKNKMSPIYINMTFGKLQLSEINSENKGDVLVMHSMPGYSFYEDVSLVEKKCIDSDVFLINDCSGSIGTDSARYGDVTVCSFGHSKPLDIGVGGFIATDDYSENILNDKTLDFTEKDGLTYINGSQKKINLSALLDALTVLNKKLNYWKKITKKVKKELAMKGFNVLNADLDSGINVLAGFGDEEEKENLIKYCSEHKLEYTLCPRYIRTNLNAISIEIKRIPFDTAKLLTEEY